VQRAAVDDQRRVRLPVPDHPGFYELGYDGDPAVRALLAVNPSPRESELRFSSEPAAVKAWSLPPREGPAPAAAAAFREMDTRALSQRLWWWLLLAAAAALAAEGGLLWRARERA
jgi:anti-sigma factor RsiW